MWERHLQNVKIGVNVILINVPFDRPRGGMPVPRTLPDFLRGSAPRTPLGKVAPVKKFSPVRKRDKYSRRRQKQHSIVCPVGFMRSGKSTQFLKRLNLYKFVWTNGANSVHSGPWHSRQPRFRAFQLFYNSSGLHLGLIFYLFAFCLQMLQPIRDPFGAVMANLAPSRLQNPT